MSDLDSEEKEEKQEATSSSGFEAITSQEQLDKVISARLARERSKYADYKDLQQKAARLDELEEANKSELQKTQDALTAANQERDRAKTELLRYQVAADKGLDSKAAGFLKGVTREELEASASELAELMQNKSTRVQPDSSQGRESNPAAGQKTDWLRDKLNNRQ